MRTSNFVVKLTWDRDESGCVFLEPAAIRSGGGERPRRRLRGHGALRWGAAPVDDVADGAEDATPPGVPTPRGVL